MKNKTFKYLLIAIVGFVWFKVFVRLKTNIDVDATIPLTSIRSIDFKKLIKPEKFDLMADYRDPFSSNGNSNYSSESSAFNQNPSIKVESQKIQQAPKLIYWPSVKYYGFVKNNTTKRPRILISVDGIFYKLRVKDQILDNLEVIEASRSDVKLRYQKESKIFRVD